MSLVVVHDVLKEPGKYEGFVIDVQGLMNRGIDEQSPETAVIDDLGTGLAGRHDDRILCEDFRHEPSECLRCFAFVQKLALFLNVFAVEDADDGMLSLDVHVWMMARSRGPMIDDYLASFMTTKYVFPLSS